MNLKTKIGKYYQIGDKYVLKADKAYQIESNEVVKEHTKVDTLPEALKEKQIAKEAKVKAPK